MSDVFVPEFPPHACWLNVLRMLLLLCTDDMSLAYHSLLPVDVRGPLGGQLRLVTKHNITSSPTVSTILIISAK